MIEDGGRRLSLEIKGISPVTQPGKLGSIPDRESEVMTPGKGRARCSLEVCKTIPSQNHFNGYIV